MFISIFSLVNLIIDIIRSDYINLLEIIRSYAGGKIEKLDQLVSTAVF